VGVLTGVIMALDATVNGANSDSFITVAVADAYFSNHLYATIWDAATTANKEKSLKMATRILDEKCAWTGTRATSTQALGWGRSDVVYDGINLQSTVIPIQISNATAEFAGHLLNSDLTANAEGKGLNSIKVGDITLDFDKSDTAGVMPEIVQEMLRGWGTIYARAKFGSVPVVRT
tara:strand:- start:1140 stop:1667 length:528 start_codon:yes stop_codon:yes gene_type:complete